MIDIDLKTKPECVMVGDVVISINVYFRDYPIHDSIEIPLDGRTVKIFAGRDGLPVAVQVINADGLAAPSGGKPGEAKDKEAAILGLFACCLWLLANDGKTKNELGQNLINDALQNTDMLASPALC